MLAKGITIYQWIFRIALAVAISIGIGYLPYKAYGPGGIPRALRLERDLKGLEDKNAVLRQENSVLRQTIKSLKEDRTVVERVAREELGLVRPNDVVFLLE